MEETLVEVPAIEPDDLTAVSPIDALWSAVEFDPSAAASLLERGGPVVAILLVLSIAALTVILYKFAQFWFRGVGRGRASERALRTWFSGRREQAATQLRRSRSPNAVVLAHAMAGIGSGLAEAIVREDAERVAQHELARLRGQFRVLESISQLAPLLGLFGTVLGMMSAFQALQASGADADPAVLAGGIWVALITTAVGLAVAIPTSFALYWFEGKVDRETTMIESSLTSLFTGRLSSPETPRLAQAPASPSMGGEPHAAS
ncbi:MAG: MotA/TolQ/ExbB proton channel family protein [Pseudomonadota bacterium]